MDRQEEMFPGDQGTNKWRLMRATIGHPRRLTILMLGLAMLLTACGGTAQPPLVVRNGMVIDGSGGPVIENGAVVIVNGVITAVGSIDEVQVPSGAQVIDAEGGAIMPGMVDAHTHVLESLNLEDGSIGDIGRIQYLEHPVRAGVTTLRDVGSHYQSAEEILELHQALDELGNVAPRIVMTGPILLAPGSWALQFGGQPIEVADGAASRMTADLISAGVDQIKILMDVGSPPSPTLSIDEVTAIVEVAHETGYWVTAHAVEKEAELAIGAGVNELAHWPSGRMDMRSDWEVTDSLIQMLVDRRIPVVGTFNITPPEEQHVRLFLDSGGILAFGTDGPGTGPLNQPMREFRFMQLFGMTPMEIIVAATHNAAEVVGLGDQVGLLQPGMLADVIVIEGNPLENISSMDEVVIVIRGGEVVFPEPDSE